MEQPLFAGAPQVRIRVRSGRLAGIAFHSFECPGALSAAGALAILTRGKAVKDIKAITNSDVIDVLGGSPEPVRRCASRGVNALRTAIAEWELRHRAGLS